MDVEAVEAWGETVHLGADLDLLTFDLGELAAAADTAVGVWVQHADGIVSSGTSFDHILG